MAFDQKEVSASMGNEQDYYDRQSDLKAFDNTKAGVKGLVDTGIKTIPKFFVAPPEETCREKTDSHLSVPVIDLKDTDKDFVAPPEETCREKTDSHLSVPVIDLKDTDKEGSRRKQVVEAIGLASNRWGCFQVVNHGILQTTMNDVIESIRRFHEQPNHVKEKFYSREKMKKVKFNSNFDLYRAKFANWRDTLSCHMAPNPLPPEEYPEACREMLMKYSESIRKLGEFLFELLSEALGLNFNHLTEMGCADGHVFFCNYYPGCPEPERTLGHTKHCDPAFLNILLQNRSGLQVLHDETNWVDIPPVEGTLVINIGELLQLISNDKFKASEHRVLANYSGPRISVGCFFTTHFEPSNKLFGPIKDLLSDESPALYRQTTVIDYIDSFSSLGHDGASASLRRLRL